MPADYAIKSVFMITSSFLSSMSSSFRPSW